MKGEENEIMIIMKWCNEIIIIIMKWIIMK